MSSEMPGNASPRGAETGAGSPMVKIWIGNIDTKLTEYQLLKIAEKFGVISSYDFLYNINDKGNRFPR
jgi:hypothetical protein